MRRIFAFLLALGVGYAAVPAERTIDYKIGANKYGVVIIQGDGISEAEAKRYGREKAAEVTVNNGYRYFTIETEDEVAVVKSNQDSPSEETMPHNLYYEVIQNENFGREESLPGDVATTDTYTGYRILFSCFKEKKGLDACNYTKCK